ncbi:MAG TPA: SDR family NAD(P)-dependent oxidoreductase [Candidatus Thermoplasmatota archaeon]|nr:SDR family NAD(P)-dependent oxidoreductase [Candidatus Thermoplasmatota archaeon]
MTGETAFITGATSGFGLATARLFASKGWDLVITSRRKKELEAVAKEIEGQHKVHATPLVFDVRDRSAIKKLQAKRPEAFDVDVLVNNAGLALGTETLQDGNPEEWDVVIDTNVKGLLYVTRAVLPNMLKRGRGHIVNIGSTAGHWTYKGGAVYCASKHAVKAIHESLRLDIHGSGVRVSSIDAGLVETNFSVVRFRGDKEKAKKVYEGLTPLSPDDIAETIWWTVSRPPHVNIHEIILMPTDQASVRDVHRRAAN